MKPKFHIPFVACALTLCLFFGSARALHASLAGEVVERVIKASGHLVDDTAKAGLKLSMQKASQKYGDEVFEIAERGGFDFLNAVSRHGDEVWRLAKLSPKAPKALASHADELVALAKRYGDDAVRVEVKAPACGEILVTSLSKKSMREIAEKAGSTEIKRFAAIAVHRSPKELEAAVRVWKRSGSSRFLKHFTPAKIAASGLALAMVVTAWQAPEAALGFVETLLAGFFGPLMTVCSWLIVIFVLVLLRKPLRWLGKTIWSMFRGLRREGRPKRMKTIDAEVIR